jgi:hypothetical protein
MTRGGPISIFFITFGDKNSNFTGCKISMSIWGCFGPLLVLFLLNSDSKGIKGSYLGFSNFYLKRPNYLWLHPVFFVKDGPRVKLLKKVPN